MAKDLDPLFRPRSVAFIGGSNLSAALRYHRDLGFSGTTHVVSPRYKELEGFACVPRIEDLAEAPDLAFVAIRAELAIEAVETLRIRGCRAVICNAAGFSELGEGGADLQSRLIAAAGDMSMLGPNSMGMINFADPMAMMMDHFGVAPCENGAAIVSQGGGLLCDAVFADRGLPVTQLVGCGNQAVTGVADCADYLIGDPRVRVVGLAFEGMPEVATLRRAAEKALALGKPLVALKLGVSKVGAVAAATHTASMAGASAAWEALFDRLGIVSTASESEFFESLKLFASGKVPKGRRVLVTAASGVTGVMMADHLSAAGFELPQPSAEVAEKLRVHLPGIATPGNPQDVTMASWNDRARQEAIYSELMAEDYDIALMVQNYPRDGMWDIAEYAAQVEALGAACAGRDVVAAQLAPLADCFPEAARRQTADLGLVPLQGLEESVASLRHGVWWQERRAELAEAGLPLAVSHGSGPEGLRLNEAEAKDMLAAAGIPVPESRVTTPESAAEAAAQIGFPVVVKALDARLLHKSEVGAVKTGLRSPEDVTRAVDEMRSEMARKAPDIPLNRLLVEAMAAPPVVEIMASITQDPSVGPVMMIAGGGVQAELWNDSTLIAAPFNRAEIARGLDRLKTSRLIEGWRGSPSGDREALLDALEAMARCAETQCTSEIEVNPILVGENGVVAVDAVVKLGSVAEVPAENIAMSGG